MVTPAARVKEVHRGREQLADSYNDLLRQFFNSDFDAIGNYALSKMVGQGSFGKVYLATHQITRSKVVLKSTNKDDPNLAREIYHHRQMKHPHIARLYEVVVTESSVYMALEYCPGQELYDYLLNNRPLKISDVQKIFAQICGAVAYVHSKSCVHRDLKLENILLDKKEDVKLCDFGFTRQSEGKKLMSSTCGTPAYAAPEMVKGEKYLGEAVDVWSLGIILYALLMGELPFDEENETDTRLKILNAEPYYSDSLPKEAVDLLKIMLCKQKTRRPSAVEVLQHPFVGSHGQSQIQVLEAVILPPFTTRSEQNLLRRMKHAGIAIDAMVDSVLAQKCDTLSALWTLSLEADNRKSRRQRRKNNRRSSSSINDDNPGPHHKLHQRNRSLSNGSIQYPYRKSFTISLTQSHEERRGKSSIDISNAQLASLKDDRRHSVFHIIKRWFSEARHTRKLKRPILLKLHSTSDPSQVPIRGVSEPRLIHQSGYPDPRLKYFIRSGIGLASTSSSVSSIHSLHMHSKPSSISSTSLSSLRSPRSSRSSVKVLPPTATTHHQHQLKHRKDFNETVPSMLTFAKRRKSPFRGPRRMDKDLVAQNKDVIHEEDICEDQSSKIKLL